MKINKLYIVLFAMIFVSSFVSAQTLLRDVISANASAQSIAFIDGTSNAGYAGVEANYAGKGILFPSMDLTLALAGAPFDSGALGDPTYNPNFYDGLVVYNTGTGDTTLGVATDVAPGFYYYSNVGAATHTTGTWTAMGGGSSSAVTITENTPVATNVFTTSEDAEQVISLTGSADGLSTHIDLGIAHLTANTVKEFRKAIVYDSLGNLVAVATASYDVETNKFVTGNGMMNLLLPAADDYKVELYYTAN